MRYAIVYVPTSTVLGTRKSESAARSYRDYVADRLGFDNVRLITVDSNVKKNQTVSL